MAMENKIQAFLDTVYRDAEAEAQAMMRQVDEAVAGALETYRRNLEKETDYRCRRAAAQADAAVSAELNQENSAMTTALYQHREQITDQVFQQVCRDLEKYTQTNEYELLLRRDAATAAALLKEEKRELFLRSKDEELAPALQKVLGPCQVLYDETIRLGGFRIRTEYVELDYTLDAKLAAAREQFTRESGLKVV